MIVPYRSSRFLICIINPCEQVKDLKKARLAILLSTILVVSLTCVYVFGAASGAESPGPAPDSGDGVPDGNQYIQPEAPGVGPVPNCGDGVPDGSGF
jgi:hypothetical protein